MATNHTENYQLNLWEPGDSFLRTEFNADNDKIDAAIKTCFQPDNLPWIKGTYTQDRTQNIVITPGFRPSIVFLTTEDPVVGILMEKASFLIGIERNGTHLVTSWFGGYFQEDGFYLSAGSPYFNNDTGRAVKYIALR